MIPRAQDQKLAGSCCVCANEEGGVALLIDKMLIGAKGVVPNLERPPLLVDSTEEKPRAPGIPHDCADRLLYYVVQHLPGRNPPDPNRVAFSAGRIDGPGVKRPTRGHRLIGYCKILVAFRLARLVENRLDFLRLAHGMARPHLVLAALFEAPLVDVVTGAPRHAAFFGRHSPLDLFEDRPGEFGLRTHLRLEVRVFSLEVGEHIGVLYLWVARVAQPVVGVFDRDAMMSLAVGFGGGDGRLHVSPESSTALVMQPVKHPAASNAQNAIPINARPERLLRQAVCNVQRQSGVAAALHSAHSVAHSPRTASSRRIKLLRIRTARGVNVV